MNTSESLSSLLKNYMNEVKDVLAVAVSDRDGLIIASQGTSDDESLIGAITASLDAHVDRIKSLFGSEGSFFNITTIGDKKFAFSCQGPNAILTTTARLSASDITLKVFSEHIARKMELLLEGNEEVSLEIPEFIRTMARTRTGILPKGDFVMKFILMGDYKAGKSSLMRRFTLNLFEDYYASTIGVDISKKDVKVGENTMVNFIIWDIAGQDSFASFRGNFYQGANAGFIVIDRTREGNLKSVERWYNDMREALHAHIPLMIVGNKSDLVDKVVISEEEIKQVSEQFHVNYILTSAKTSMGVNDAFMHLAYRVILASGF